MMILLVNYFTNCHVGSQTLYLAFNSYSERLCFSSHVHTFSQTCSASCFINFSTYFWHEPEALMSPSFHPPVSSPLHTVSYCLFNSFFVCFLNLNSPFFLLLTWFTLPVLSQLNCCNELSGANATSAHQLSSPLGCGPVSVLPKRSKSCIVLLTTCLVTIAWAQYSV